MPAPHAPADGRDPVDAVDALLPQTQCRQCGHAGCRPYARAIVDGHAPINRCPPGGAAAIQALSRLTGRAVLPLDPRCGAESRLQVAFVIESLCIGCTKCLQACPVDAISGAAGWLHTVLPALCTGCRLCVAPCPVDCIEMQEVTPTRDWTRADADAARRRHEARAARLARERIERERSLGRKALGRPFASPATWAGMGTPPAIGTEPRLGAGPHAGTEPHAEAESPIEAGPRAGTGPRVEVGPRIGAEPVPSDAIAALARKRAVIEAAVARARRRAAASRPAASLPDRAPR